MKISFKKHFLVLVIFIFPFYHFAAPVDNTLFEYLKYSFRLLSAIYIITNFNYIKFLRTQKNSSFLIYCFYLLLCGVSLLYSSDVLYSLVKFVDLIIITLFTMILFNKEAKSSNQVLEIINKYLVFYVLLFFVVGYFSYPYLYRNMGQDGVARLGGYLINPNLLAYVLICVILINTYFFRKKIKIYSQNFKRNRAFIFSIILLSLYFLFITYSRSGYICFMTVMSLYLLQIIQNKYKWLIVGLIAGIGIILIGFNFELLLDTYTRGEENSLTTLSGRLPIWNELLKNYELNEYFLLGHGFQMLSESGIGININSFAGGHNELSMAHNNVLQVLFGLGILGLFVSILVFIKLFEDLGKIRDIEMRMLLKHLVIVLIFFSFVEFGVYGPNNILIFVFTFILYVSSRNSFHGKYD